MIVSSFRTQYNISLKDADLDEDEFFSLLSGLNETTALIKIVQIRSETDKDILKHYTPEMKKIRQDWFDRFKDDDSNKEKIDNNFKAIFNAFKAMSKRQ